ncbi:SH3 domain-containing protein [Nitratireductor sp. CAU 1489]|uniref:SH3 domain-containing protein n=1 Tax=Nitratireductor arenosus TaxID=2682096 RepID=A0A844QK04_9HYPH|nr:SH3 domain-containing protein [Nitratireductor arenosus]MVA98368.1 SH3 domain-containing protein [Nitratireductor arenosus]
MQIFSIVTIAALLALGLGKAGAQEIREERVRFEAGTSGTTLGGTIRGYEIVDYLLGAGTGQEMAIEFETTNPSAHFNLMPAGSETAIHIGSSGGNAFTGILPQDGDYRIRVYLMRNAARRDEEADYALSISISGGAAANPDYADGLSGGPDFWRVANVPANDTLNVRSAPGTGNPVVGELANGDRVRNLGCDMHGQSRWCRIEAGFDQKFTGWVNGRYLRE